MRDALKGCEGVKDVEIDFDTKTATAIVGEDFTDANSLVNAVKAINGDYAQTALK